MVWRKWLVRLLVFSIVGCAAVVAVIYQHFTNPAAVRQQVITRLAEHLPGAKVSVESASLRLMGGITFQDLHLSRRDDPNDTVFLEVPSGTIYHDKEQLLDGTVAIRKIEFDKPWLRVVREKNGAWNLTGILGAVDLTKSIPTIVLKQATVFLEDKAASPPVEPLQIKDVNLSIINNPRDTLVFEGSGVCKLIGTIWISGNLRRDTDQFSLCLHMPEVTIGGDLIQRLAGYQPAAADQLRMLTGKCKNLRADLYYDPHMKPAWSYALRTKIADGRFAHAHLPMTLEQVEGDVSMINGVLDLNKLVARFGETRLELSGKIRPDKESFDLDDGHLIVSRLCIDEALLKNLPPTVDEFNKLFRPRGFISFYIEAERHSGHWSTRTHFEPEDMRAACQKFPYELERIRGMVEQDSDLQTGLDLIKIDLTGYSGTHAVSVRGKMGEKGPGSVAVHVATKDLPIDAKLRAALLPQYQQIVDSFQPKGQIDVDVDIVRSAGGKEFENRIIARFHDANISYDLFPYPIEMVGGTVEILPDHWEFHDFVGMHKRGTFRAKGGSWPLPGNQGHDLNIALEGDRILLDQEIAGALKQPALQQTWTSLNPGGHIRFNAQVTKRNQDAPPDIRVQVVPQEQCNIYPTVFPYAMDVSLRSAGSIEYHDRQVDLKQIRCRHNSLNGLGTSELSLKEGKVTCKINGGFSIDLEDLVGNPVVPDAELGEALPRPLGVAVKTMELRDPLSLQIPQLTVNVSSEGDAPHVYWDGAIRLQNAFLRLGVPLENVSGVVQCSGEYQQQLKAVEGHAKIRQATLFGQPLENVETRFTVNGEQPGTILLRGVAAELFGGKVGGVVKIQTDQGLKYELNLNVTQAELEAFGKHNKVGVNTQLSGQVSAGLFLQGDGTDLNTLRGNGRVDIPTGKIYNLPPIVRLLKFLKFRFPDTTAFDEAHAQFAINGRSVQFSRLDLYGDAVSLGGQGGMQLDGTGLQIDFYALVGPFNARMLPMLENLEAFISKRILKIKMRGSLLDPICSGEPAPMVVEPIKEFLNAIRGRNREFAPQ